MTSCDFQLDINRLKVLGAIQLNELDKRIEELKGEENSIINDTTLIEISQMILQKNKSISDLNCILDSYNSGVTSKQTQYEQKEKEEQSIKLNIESKIKECEEIAQNIEQLDNTIKALEENKLVEIQEIKNERLEKVKQKEEQIRLTGEMIKIKEKDNNDLETKCKELEKEHKRMYQVYLDKIKIINENLQKFKTNYLFNFNQIGDELLKLNTDIHFDLNDMNKIYTSKLRDKFMSIWCKNSKKFINFYDAIKFIKSTQGVSHRIVNTITSQKYEIFISILNKYLNNKIKRETSIFEEDIPEVKEFVNFMENDFSLHLVVSNYGNRSNDFVRLFGYKNFIKYFMDNVQKYYHDNNCGNISSTLCNHYMNNFFDRSQVFVIQQMFTAANSYDSRLTNRFDLSKYSPDENGNIHYDSYGNIIPSGGSSQHCPTLDHYLKGVYDRIKRDYKKLLYPNLYTNDLKHLIDKLTFDELHDLFAPDFCVNDLKPDMFIVFLNFMGTDGKFIDFMGNEYKFLFN